MLASTNLLTSPSTELVVARRAWERGWRGLLLHPEGWGLAAVRREASSTGVEFLIEALSSEVNPNRVVVFSVENARLQAFFNYFFTKQIGL